MKNRHKIELGAAVWKLFSDENKSAKYRKHYSDASFWDKLKRYSKSAGMKVIYPAMLLQYMMKSDEVSLKTKLLLSAALGYFILPLDLIPDFAPLLGFADDLGVLLLVIKQMSGNITPEIRKKAREHLQKWFGETDSKELDLLDLEYSGKTGNSSKSDLQD